MAAATTELWPSISNAMASPWRVFGPGKQSAPPSMSRGVQQRPFTQSAPTNAAVSPVS
jgi:hypothetical protein